MLLSLTVTSSCSDMLSQRPESQHVSVVALNVTFLYAANGNQTDSVFSPSIIRIKWMYCSVQQELTVSFYLKCVAFPFIVVFLSQTCSRPPTFPHERESLVRTTKESDSMSLILVWLVACYSLLTCLPFFPLIIFLSYKYAVPYVWSRVFCLIYFHLSKSEVALHFFMASNLSLVFGVTRWTCLWQVSSPVPFYIFFNSERIIMCDSDFPADKF